MGDTCLNQNENAALFFYFRKIDKYEKNEPKWISLSTFVQR